MTYFTMYFFLQMRKVFNFLNSPNYESTLALHTLYDAVPPRDACSVLQHMAHALRIIFVISILQYRDLVLFCVAYKISSTFVVSYCRKRVEI